MKVIQFNNDGVTLALREAQPEDTPSLAALVNRAYRGESSRDGWTTEADLLGGLRIDETWLNTILNDPDSMVLLARKEGKIIASIHASRDGSRAHFGLFAVEPRLQGTGIGKALLAFAESEVIRRWGVTKGVMEVITHREELIAFYGRQGYKKSGTVVPFPASDLWAAKVPFLEMEVLEKAF